VTPEIRAFEYSLGLFAVLIGLAVADVANSFHRLVRSRTPVVWDPLALLAALYALCMAVGMWTCGACATSPPRVAPPVDDRGDVRAAPHRLSQPAG
jgi:hypothetical protein